MQPRYLIITLWTEDDDLRPDEQVRQDFLSTFGLPEVECVVAEPLAENDEPRISPAAPGRPSGRRHRPLPQPEAVRLAEVYRGRARAARDVAAAVSAEATVAAELDELHRELRAEAS